MVTNNAINVATGASNTILQGQGVGTAPVFSTATYPATTTINQILYSSAANTVTGLATANTAVLATNGSGVPSITATPTVTSITFGAGSALSTYTAAATWTPALQFGGLSTGITYTTQVGKYYQIGGVVYFNISIVLSSKGSATGSALVLLPSTAASDNVNQECVVVMRGGATAFPTSTTMLYGEIASGVSSVSLFGLGTAGSSNIADTQFTNTTLLRISGFYWTA